MQVLRAAETLPLMPDDVHVIISAYGSFAAALADLCRMSFPQEVCCLLHNYCLIVVIARHYTLIPPPQDPVLCILPVGRLVQAAVSMTLVSHCSSAPDNALHVLQLKLQIQRFLDKFPLSTARPDIQAAVAEAAGSFRDLPQHKGFMEASHKRRSLESGKFSSPLQPAFCLA